MYHFANSTLFVMATTAATAAVPLPLHRTNLIFIQCNVRTFHPPPLLALRHPRICPDQDQPVVAWTPRFCNKDISHFPSEHHRLNSLSPLCQRSPLPCIYVEQSPFVHYTHREFPHFHILPSKPNLLWQFYSLQMLRPEFRWFVVVALCFLIRLFCDINT